MHLPVIADVARVAILGQDAPDNIKTANVIHLHRASSSDSWSTIAGDVATLLGTGAVDNMWGCCSSSFGIYAFDLTPLDGSSASIHVDEGSLSWPVGTIGGQSIPQVAGVVTMQTGVRGRSNRGRVFLGPVAEGYQDGGELTGGIDALITTAWTNFANGLEAMTHAAALTVASYKHANDHQVINVFCRTRTGTQRRRQHR